MKSNKPKHTPGPWKSSCKFGGATEIQDFMTIVDSDNRLFVGLASTEANARLIAAAPEMLEALETVLNLYKSTGMSPEEHEVNRLVWNAVNKARGES